MAPSVNAAAVVVVAVLPAARRPDVAGDGVVVPVPGEATPFASHVSPKPIELKWSRRSSNAKGLQRRLRDPRHPETPTWSSNPIVLWSSIRLTRSTVTPCDNIWCSWVCKACEVPSTGTQPHGQGFQCPCAWLALLSSLYASAVRRTCTISDAVFPN